MHGPDYIHTHKGKHFHDSLLCLGNLKVFCSIHKQVVDKLAMDYIFSGRKRSEDWEIIANESVGESFNYNE